MARILDKKDANGCLHHGYSFLYMNTDIESATGEEHEPAKAFVVDETRVIIEIPSASNSLLRHFEEIEPQLERNQRGGKYDESISKANNTLVDQLLASDCLKKFRVLVKFENGEELTNIPFAATEERFGRIPQLPRATNRLIAFGGVEIPLCEMFTMFHSSCSKGT